MSEINPYQVLHHLVSRSAAPSSFGSQLERLRNGQQASRPDPFRARDEAEAEMLEKAQLLRCIDEFSARPEFRSNNRDAFAILDKIQRVSALHPPQGAIALGILRAYWERCSKSEERGLVEIYRFIARIAPKVVPPPPKGSDDLHQTFREGRAKRARAVCAEAYADSYLALAYHLDVWNKKAK